MSSWLTRGYDAALALDNSRDHGFLREIALEQPTGIILAPSAVIHLVHFDARAASPALGSPEGHIVEAADIYRLYFHGPAYQVVERAWWDGHRIIGLMAKGLPANHLPSELPTLMTPRPIELCFQTAGVWEMGAQGRLGLPQHIDRVSSSLVAAESAGTRLFYTPSSPPTLVAAASMPKL